MILRIEPGVDFDYSLKTSREIWKACYRGFCWIPGVTLEFSRSPSTYLRALSLSISVLNGIYTVADLGSANTPWVLTRDTKQDKYGLTLRAWIKEHGWVESFRSRGSVEYRAVFQAQHELPQLYLSTYKPGLVLEQCLTRMCREIAQLVEQECITNIVDAEPTSISGVVIRPYKEGIL